MCAGKLFGAILPYPIVPIVSTLKKNARQNTPPMRAGFDARERIDAARQVEKREHGVRDHVTGDHDRKEPRPRDREEIVIEAQRTKKRQPVSAGIEAPVAIEQPLLICSANDGTEPEIFRFVEWRDFGLRHISQVPGTRCLVPENSDSWFYTNHLVRFPGTWHLAPGTWHLAPGTWYLAPGTWHLAPGT